LVVVSIPEAKPAVLAVWRASQHRAGHNLVPLLTRRLKFRLQEWELEDTVWKLIKSVSKNTSKEDTYVFYGLVPADLH
jgi:hypothetical protein